MLRSFASNPILILYFVPALLISLSMHELCHGYAAYLMGDPTAKNQGRLSLNPLVHLDPMGTIVMLVAGFGWAKPVPVNPMYFDNRKLGMAITAVAGPLSNLAMGFLSIVGICIIGTAESTVAGYFQMFFYIMTTINIGLAVFNLLPISPLDGSKILYAFLPGNVYFKIMRYEQYFTPVLFLLLFFGILTVPISFLRNLVITGFSYLVAPIFRIDTASLLHLFGIY